MESHNHFYNFLNDIDCERDIHHMHNGTNKIDAALFRRRETNIKRNLFKKIRKDRLKY